MVNPPPPPQTHTHTHTVISHCKHRKIHTFEGFHSSEVDIKKECSHSLQLKALYSGSFEISGPNYAVMPNIPKDGKVLRENKHPVRKNAFTKMRTGTRDGSRIIIRQQ